MTAKSTELDIGLALVGSILMFLGWALAIVPAFRHVDNVILPLALGIIGFGIVLVPAGLEFFGTLREDADEKGSSVTVIASVLPAAILFAVTLTAFRISTPFRIVAVVAEVLGMVAYGWTFWAQYHAPPRSFSRGHNRTRQA